MSWIINTWQEVLTPKTECRYVEKKSCITLYIYTIIYWITYLIIIEQYRHFDILFYKYTINQLVMKNHFDTKTTFECRLSTQKVENKLYFIFSKKFWFHDLALSKINFINY